jgi:hypothetical protein
LGGTLINGDLTGIVTQGGRLRNVQVSTTAALVGTLTISDSQGSNVAPANLNGVWTPAADLWGTVSYQLSSAADVGKARVTWSWG